jgi:hypothetical protein
MDRCCIVVCQSRGVHGKSSLVVDGPSLGAVFIQVGLHVQIFRAQRQLSGLEELCVVCGEHAAENLPTDQ